MVLNDFAHAAAPRMEAHSESEATSRPSSTQDAIAVVGIGCRLPGNSNSPDALWDFIERGSVAHNEPPKTRFHLEAHFDGSRKPHTMRSPGGMFLENIDPRDFDAGFFNTSRVDAIAMDPQQRQLLEVVYECLENAGIPLEKLDGAAVGCFVGSYAVDYADMQARDPEDRAQSITVGIGRAILSNRISHFLNIKGPSMTIDTACSGSLVSVDVACHYLQTRQMDGAIVAASNIYLSPEHNMDMGAMRGASSATGKCHTFDAKADGYIKSEAVNVVMLKRLDDAVRDRDPIRAIIRGTSTNSDGRTPGIASPSSEAQAAAIRAAYANAGITDFNETTYLECHGTGTLAGDPIEVAGAAAVFSPTRCVDKPLVIGSIKSNIGHSEPAAGISGLLKAILSIEKGVIPGNPTFVDPNPKIDFAGMRVRATRTAIKWPDASSRRASVNSFGYGGSNAHVVLEEAEQYLQRPLSAQTSSYVSSGDEFFNDDEDSIRPHLLILSANDEESLKAYCRTLSTHLLNPSVSIKLKDLAYTLSERRTRHFHRAYMTTQSVELDEDLFILGKKSAEAPRVAFVFTGQGAQWSQMGMGLVDNFPAAKLLLQRLDAVLQALPTPPRWSLLNELVEARNPEHLRLPEFSQPLVTALQLAMLEILEIWGVRAQSVVGHSSGEIAAACAAGYLTPEEAIKVAYFRGLAATDCKTQSTLPVGMLAVGLSPEKVQEYLEPSEEFVQIACYNSPDSITLSGPSAELDVVKARLQEDGHFARMLQVNLAYHSKYMAEIGDRYETLLRQTCEPSLGGNASVTMFSSVTGGSMGGSGTDVKYWKSNMVSPVRFEQACSAMVSGRECADFLIELGPSGALAGPIAQIKKALPGGGTNIKYCAAAKRGPDSVMSMFGVAGQLFTAGGNVAISEVNRDDSDFERPAVILDLPNYVWNHWVKYWHESEASKDWRFRRFPHHDLLGSKILGTSWTAPSWKKTLNVADLPWLKDHRMGHDIVFPAAGYIGMAVEAVYQTSIQTLFSQDDKMPENYRFRLRNVKCPRALVLDENDEHKIMLALAPVLGSKDAWYEFKVSSLTDETRNEHSTGLIRIELDAKDVPSQAALQPLQHTTPGRLWYKAMHDAGYNFGPHFQKQLEIESTAGQRRSRSLVSLVPPTSAWDQSCYPMHPACIDGCFQSVAPSLWKGDRSNINSVLVPAMVDNIVVASRPTLPEQGVSITTSEYLGVGRREDMKNYSSSGSVYDPTTGNLVFEITGLSYHRLETREDIHAAHMYTSLSWQPDITFVDEPQLCRLAVENSATSLNDERNPAEVLSKVINLVAHKKPNLKVMEINLDPKDTSSLWLQRDFADTSARAAVKQYHFVFNDANALIKAQEQHDEAGGAIFALHDLTKPEHAPSETDFDFVIAKIPGLSEDITRQVGQNVRALLAVGGIALFVEHSILSSDSDSEDNVIVSGDAPGASGDTSRLLSESGFGNTRKFAYDQRSSGVTRSAYTATAVAVDATADRSPDREINLVRLTENTRSSSTIEETLRTLGWQLVEHSCPFAKLKAKSTVLVLDELFSPVLATANEAQWQAIKHLVNTECKILWVTSGSQMDVTNPSVALAHGFFRTIRAEEPALSITTLDVASESGPATVEAINKALRFIGLPKPKKQMESELVERHGIIHVSRVFADEPINQAKLEDGRGGLPRSMDLRGCENCVRLRCERLGNIDSLQYGEVSAAPLPVKDNCVEVEIFAAGLNFKDVAVTMGIVPENEHLLGLEGAGTITRLGKDVRSLRVGQRVVVFEKGTFANRIQATTERVFPLPDSMTYEEAATLPAVYLTSMYSLFYLANLQKGQRVLIHSASGGVGIASIQLCRYMNAEVFVTCGTDEKREFLMKTFCIPAERIFSSRTADFAKEIMSITDGEGVDVILNSLTGDLLDESWRIIADGGTMVEIGKKDIIDRNRLSMEPFGRNASFRAVDFSHKQISDVLIAKILAELFGLLRDGHVKPIAPIKLTAFDDVPAAFRFMRGGKHIGKIVASGGPDARVEVPVRPAERKLCLRTDVAYLIVGGLKGLCGSLAVYLAMNGAKHLAVISRSGHMDETSRGVVKNINALDCQIDLLKGDVAVHEDVKRCFAETTVPIGGIVQGAMVLRDKTFASMTLKDYHEALACKVQGTWNLHSAALEQNLPLEFFTMLSSISGVVGQKGQANYAAGNVFLDSFAVYRQSVGLPACSVDLGVIEDVGYIHNHDGLQQNLDTSIWTGINESLLRKILRLSILQQVSPINKASSTQLITGIPVPQPEKSELLRDARFGGLFIGDGSRISGQDSKDSSKDIQALSLLVRSKADPSAVLAGAVDVVNKHFTKSLRLSEPMEPAKSLSVYGLDSLAAVEFRNWVRMELNAELMTLEIVNATSLIALCEKIVAKIAPPS